MKRRGESLVRVKQRQQKEELMQKETSSLLTPAQAAELSALADLPDDQIDTTDIPEVTDWRNAQRGRFYRPVKQQITLRLDADLIAWFKSRGKDADQRGYQTQINQVLRQYMEAQRVGE